MSRNFRSGPLPKQHSRAAVYAGGRAPAGCTTTGFPGTSRIPQIPNLRGEEKVRNNGVRKWREEAPERLGTSSCPVTTSWWRRASPTIAPTCGQLRLSLPVLRHVIPPKYGISRLSLCERRCAERITVMPRPCIVSSHRQ